MQKPILSALIFSFALFLLFVLVLPQYNAIKIAKEAVKSRQALFNERTAGFNNVGELDRQAKSRQADIDKIKAFIPERKQIDEVVSSIQKITEQSGLQLSGLTISEVSLAGEVEYRKIFVGVDTIGAYPAFVNFLKFLEQSLRLYDVFEITMSGSTATIDKVNFAIKMNAYYLK